MFIKSTPAVRKAADSGGRGWFRPSRRALIWRPFIDFVGLVKAWEGSSYHRTIYSKTPNFADFLTSHAPHTGFWKFCKKKGIILKWFYVIFATQQRISGFYSFCNRICNSILQPRSCVDFGALTAENAAFRYLLLLLANAYLHRGRRWNRGCFFGKQPKQ